MSSVLGNLNGTVVFAFRNFHFNVIVLTLKSNVYIDSGLL
jgi:hypothetical protein